MFDCQFTIIGAGVVGLAIAEQLSRKHQSTLVVEKNKLFGQETSSRNSEVIHAGIYYPKGSLKAKLCVEGKKKLYAFCDEYEVPYSNCGKLIVATSKEEVDMLEGIKTKANANGVDDIIFLSGDEVKDYEPNVNALAALYSPSTGIIESHSYMKQLETNAVVNGVEFAYGNEVIGIEKIEGGYKINIKEPDGELYSFTTQYLINSAGLESDKISSLLDLKDEYFRIQFCKGQYFRVNPPKNKLVGRLVYPVPNPNLAGLGIHVTTDLSKGVKLGPDATYLDENVYDYKVDASRQTEFFESVKRFLPFIEYDDLSPEMAGIRPKIQKKGETVKDFYIQEESQNGLPNFINLIGIESPGLTASLAIGEYVCSLIKQLPQ